MNALKHGERSREAVARRGEMAMLVRMVRAEKRQEAEAVTL